MTYATKTKLEHHNYLIKRYPGITPQEIKDDWNHYCTAKGSIVIPASDLKLFDVINNTMRVMGIFAHTGAGEKIDPNIIDLVIRSDKGHSFEMHLRHYEKIEVMRSPK